MSAHYAAILELVGADTDSEGLRETPRRAAKALYEMTEGSRMGLERIVTLFKSECEATSCHDMVMVEDIREVALCEHHLLPFPMSITIAYIPGERILGLSKMMRIAALFSRRLQNQERVGKQIADFMEEVLEPLGVAVLIEGRHTCSMARGVRDHNATMKVDVMRGLFKEDPTIRAELLSRVGPRGKTLI
ncbi:MAG TPA: GTP cyclohydrolase I [Candidatus Paceibacterota bacterium]|nr:GTP cyclohydrolase I [Candidatus Paceibacterota bacterium]